MHSEENNNMKPKEKTISIKVPRMKLPSLQAGILILLIVVGALQTAQLYGLNLQISSGQVQATTRSSTSASDSTSGSTTSSLPQMVGGC